MSGPHSCEREPGALSTSRRFNLKEMIVAKQLMMWESTTGSVFRTRAEALREDQKAEFANYCKTHPLNLKKCDVEGAVELIEWVAEHKDAVAKFLGIQIIKE